MTEVKPTDGRIDRLEAVVERLETTVDQLAKSVRTMGKTSWPLVAMIIGMAITTFFGTATLLITLGMLAISPISNKLDVHAALPGHPQTMIKVATLDERVQNQDVRIDAIQNQLTAQFKNFSEDIDEIRRMKDLVDTIEDLVKAMERERLNAHP